MIFGNRSVFNMRDAMKVQSDINELIWELDEKSRLCDGSSNLCVTCDSSLPCQKFFKSFTALTY